MRLRPCLAAIEPGGDRMDHHFNRSNKTEESVSQQIIFEFGVCLVTLLTIALACELAFRGS
jgi:hypothetical protein